MIYPITDNEVVNMKLQLKATEFNINTENKLLAVAAEALTAYGNKAYNKRFVTFVNAKLAEAFGTYKVERYDAGKIDVNNVEVYLATEEFISKHTRFNFGYEGREVGRYYGPDDSHAKGPELQKRHRHEVLYNSDTLEQLAEALQNRIKYNNENLAKLLDNRRKLASMVKRHNKLSAEINQHNDAVFYAISDTLRLK